MLHCAGRRAVNNSAAVTFLRMTTHTIVPYMLIVIAAVAHERSHWRCSGVSSSVCRTVVLASLALLLVAGAVELHRGEARVRHKIVLRWRSRHSPPDDHGGGGGGGGNGSKRGRIIARLAVQKRTVA